MTRRQWKKEEIKRYWRKTGFWIHTAVILLILSVLFVLIMDIILFYRMPM